jgi:hypothetical protein
LCKGGLSVAPEYLEGTRDREATQRTSMRGRPRTHAGRRRGRDGNRNQGGTAVEGTSREETRGAWGAAPAATLAREWTVESSGPVEPSWSVGSSRIRVARSAGSTRVEWAVPGSAHDSDRYSHCAVRHQMGSGLSTCRNEPTIPIPCDLSPFGGNATRTAWMDVTHQTDGGCGSAHQMS